MDDYCAYLRKSRADRDAEQRGEGETLARHKQLLSEVADRMKLPISKWYSEVVSGETIADRPVMQELLAAVESGRWTGVLVVEVERLARGNTKDQGIVADAFKYSNTKIITPSKTYDPENEFDEEYFEFGLFMSRREYKTINRRLQRGRLASLKEGKYICSTAPYGYRKVKIPHDKGYTLEIIPDQAEIVRQIFEWYCNGEVLQDGSYQRLGTNAIAARLDTLGIKPVAGDQWSKATINDMLRNKTYAGYVFFGRQKEVKSSINGKIVKMRRNANEYLCVKGLHPALISNEMFERVQAVRKSNKKNTVPSSMVLQNPLSGIVFCKKCGKMMTRLAPNSRNRYATLKCPNRYCDNISSPIFLVEEQLLTYLSHLLDAYEVKNPAPHPLPLQKDIEDKELLAAKLGTDISSLHKQLNRAYDLLEQEVYTLDVFRSRQETLTYDIKKLENSLLILNHDISQLKKAQTEKELFVPRVQHLLDTYTSNSVEVNNRLLQEVVDKIYYEKLEPNHRGTLHNANFTLEIFPKLPS